MKETVFVRSLKDDTYIPVQAEIKAYAVYLLNDTDKYNPVEEAWEFPPGTLVRVQAIDFNFGSGLVAVDLA
ncbi:MAG: hypothetical protein V4543_09315 [Bacteroidota bacterium]